jgi:hypothetical protein
VTLVAWYHGYATANTSIQVTVQQSSLTAQVSPSGSFTIAADKSITLNASSSTEFDLASLSFSWSCSIPEFGTECVDGNGNPLDLSTSSSVLTIGPNTLKSNSIYNFIVTIVTQDGRIAIATSSVSIIYSFVRTTPP